MKPSKTADVLSIEGDSSEGEIENEGEWISSGENGVWTRNHMAGSRRLSTPSGLTGSPRRPSSLSGRGTTEGVYDESGEKCIIVDDWKDSRCAHRSLSGSWTGTTTFDRLR